MFEVESTHLNGIVVLRTSRHTDERGFFEELYKLDELWSHGIEEVFVQDNHSRSHKGVVRGLHYQLDPPMGKLISVLRGAAQFIELDIRKDSASFGRHTEIELTEDNNRIMWVPAGFANGFCALTDNTDVLYKCTALYNPKAQGSVHPLDESLNIKWKTDNPILSAKDREAPTLLSLGLIR